jgi:hypothetical protein
VNTPAKPARAAGAAAPRPEKAAGGDSSLDRIVRAVKMAFFATVRSAFDKNTKQTPPSGVESAKTVAATELVARADAAPKQPSPAPAAKAPVVAATTAPSPASAPAAAAGTPTPAKRPDWVDAPPQPSADSYELAVNSGPWKTRVECERALKDEIDLAVDNYVAWQLGDEARSQVSLADDAVRHQLLAEQWLEKIDTKFGEQMLSLHALLRFDSSIDSKLRDAWNQLLVSGRIIGSGAILGAVLLLLAVIYAYLRFSRSSPRPLRERG